MAEESPIMRAWRKFAMADPEVCDREWDAYLALVDRKETASCSSPTNASSLLHHRAPAPTVINPSTTRSTAALCAPSGAATTTMSATSSAGSAPCDGLSPESRRLYDLLVGDSASPTPATSPRSPSSASFLSGIPEPAVATTALEKDLHSMTPSTCSTVFPGDKTMSPISAAANSSSTSARIPASVTTPAATSSRGIDFILAPRAPDLSPEAEAIYQLLMADQTVYEIRFTEYAEKYHTSSCRRSSDHPTPATAPELTIAPIIVDIHAADLAVSAPATCLAECPSRNGSVLVAELISPATSISSTTTCDVVPELAASAVSEEAPSADDNGTTSKNVALLPLELIESELPGSKELFVRPLLPQFAQVEASRVAPLSTVPWSQFQPDHVQFSGEHQYSQLIPGATLSLLPWDPGDSTIMFWNMRILFQYVTSYEFLPFPWAIVQQQIVDHRFLAGFDLTATLFAQYIFDHCLRHLQFQHTNNLWLMSLQSGRLQDIVGEFLELKSWPFWLSYLEYYGGVNMSWQQVCAPVLSEHFRWQIAWSNEFSELESASSLQAIILYWSIQYPLQYDRELLQCLIAWLAIVNGYAVVLVSYLYSPVWVTFSPPYGAEKLNCKIAGLLNLRTMQLTFWSYCLLSQFTVAPDYYPLRSIHSLGLLLQIVLLSSDYCHLVFCSMGTCSFLQSSECPWFLASGDEMEMRPALTHVCSAVCYDSACFAWEIAWLLVGTSYACSDFERTENDTGKSRPPNFIWQDWLSCLMGHIIQCGCDLLQGKIAWSLNCEFACLTSEDFLLLHEGEIWQASFIVSSYWLGGGAVGYMFCAAFLFSRDRNSTIDSVLAIKHNSGMFNHTLQILEFGNYGAMEIILWSSHLSQVWVLYLPTTSRRQCGSQLMLWELASSEDDILTYTKQVFISWDPGGPAPVLDAAAGINRRSIPWPFSHLTWDPGGYTQHRLEGKPNLKEGGLSGTCPTLNRGPSALGMTPPASIGKKGTNTWDKATEKDGLDGTDGLGLEGEESLACRLFCVFFFL